MSRTVLLVLAVLPALLTHALGAHADGRKPARTSEEKRASAKEEFKHGVTLLEANDHEAALERFEESRGLWPSISNTTNAAVCLDHLGRFDEALELYEEMLTTFAAQLDDETRADVVPAMERLRPKVGSIDVSSNVDGLVVIDARPRRRLPLRVPLRVLPGSHVVRVIKDGFGTFERKVELRAGERLSLDAECEPLAGIGSLRIEDPALVGSDVFVDGSRVGNAPWEGTLAPGPHVVWTRLGDRGSAPTRATVLEGQTVLTRVISSPLGSEIRIDVEPPTAEIALDDVRLGARTWAGRLPAGSYRVQATEPGFTTASRFLSVQAGEAEGTALRVKLEPDATHPRWPRAAGAPFVEAFGGLARGSGLDTGCPDGCGGEDPAVLGLVGGVRGGFRFRSGLALEAAGGFARFESEVARRATDPAVLATGDVAYSLREVHRIQGGFAAVGASYRQAMTSWLAVVPRVSAALLVSAATSDVTGTMRSGSGAAHEAVGGETIVAPTLFAMPEVGLVATFGRAYVGASLGLALFPLAGPTMDAGVGPKNALSDGDCQKDSVQCAARSNVAGADRAHGAFVVWVPQITAGTTF